jgi:hypothetical protein
MNTTPQSLRAAAPVKTWLSPLGPASMWEPSAADTAVPTRPRGPSTSLISGARFTEGLIWLYGLLAAIASIVLLGRSGGKSPS